MSNELTQKHLNELIDHMDGYLKAVEKLRADEVKITERFSLPGGELRSGFDEELRSRRQLFLSEWGKNGWRNYQLVREHLDEAQRPTEAEVAAMHRQTMTGQEFLAYLAENAQKQKNTHKPKTG